MKKTLVKCSKTAFRDPGWGSSMVPRVGGLVHVNFCEPAAEMRKWGGGIGSSIVYKAPPAGSGSSKRGWDMVVPVVVTKRGGGW